MKRLVHLLVSGTMLATFLQPSLATMARNPLGNPSGPAPTETTSVIERGGTIQGVDLMKKTIVVDDANYALSTTSPLIIHTPSGQTSGKLTELKPGMKIRFNTSKYNFSARQQVVEIWVISPSNAPSGKSVRK